METAKGKVLLNIPVELPAATYDQIKAFAKVEDPAPKIQAWVKWFLGQYASGGLMLSSAELKQVERHTGIELATGRQVVDVILKGAGMEDGQHTYRIQLDPAFITPAEETAKSQGVTMQHLVEDAINTMLENGWLYTFVPEGGVARFSRSDWSVIQKATNKQNPTGADIAALFVAAAKE